MLMPEKYKGTKSTSSVGSAPAVSSEELQIEPFMANLLSAMATMLQGTVDLPSRSVFSSCGGRIRLGLEDVDTVRVYGLYIDPPEKQRNGCGTKMLKALETSISMLSLSTMNIKLWPVRSAVGFYLKNGYSLEVSSDEMNEYYMARDKAFGLPLDKYLAKTRAAIDAAAPDGNWTHEILWPIFEASQLFNADNPYFYSLWVSDVSMGDYVGATKKVQPSRGTELSRRV